MFCGGVMLYLSSSCGTDKAGHVLACSFLHVMWLKVAGGGIPIRNTTQSGGEWSKKIPPGPNLIQFNIQLCFFCDRNTQLLSLQEGL